MNGCSSENYLRFLTIAVASCALFTTSPAGAEESGGVPSPPEVTIAAEAEVPADAGVGISVDRESLAQHQEKLRELFKQLAKEDSYVVYKAGAALLNTAAEEDIPMLIAELKKGYSADAKKFIMKALGSMAQKVSPEVNQQVAEALRFELDYGDIAVKPWAVDALGQIGTGWPVPILLRLVESSADFELRLRAVAALGWLGTGNARYGLKAILGRNHRGALARAIRWSLDNLGNRLVDEPTDVRMPPGQKLDLLYHGKRYFFYHPSYRSKKEPDPWLLVCIHDSSLNAAKVFNMCYEMARKEKLALLVPFFDPMNFVSYNTFNIHGTRADTYLLDLIKHVSHEARLQSREVYLYGAEQGGDFVQYFTMVYPHRVARAVSVKPTTFLLPKKSEMFPYGLKENPLAPDIKIDPYKFLKASLAIIHFDSKQESRQTFATRKFVGLFHRYAAAQGFVPHVEYVSTFGSQSANVVPNYLFHLHPVK